MNQPDNNKILRAYIPLVEFIAKSVGPDCEVVLHDVSNLEESVIAIENKHVSGRDIGSPLTDLALKVLKGYKNIPPHITNYRGETKEGRILRSSTFFIRNDEGQVIGMICINIDITDAMLVKEFAEKSTDYLEKTCYGWDVGTAKEVKEVIRENFSHSFPALMEMLINDTLKEYDVDPSRMNSDEKMSVVKKLDAKGVFLIKGSVSEIAKRLDVSEATVYRYLK